MHRPIEREPPKQRLQAARDIAPATNSVHELRPAEQHQQHTPVLRRDAARRFRDHGITGYESG
jgi:hypothetical protein